jgi:hypothetical protein
MSKETEKTIGEWAEIYGVQILDPDGWDRTDPELWTREITEKEFNKGIVFCTIMVHKGGRLWPTEQK